MFCKNCGKELENPGGFCPFCGAALETQAPEAAVNDKNDAPAPAEAAQEAPVFTQPAENLYGFSPAQAADAPIIPLPAKKNNKKLFIILSVAAVALIAIVVVLVIALTSKSKQNGSDPSSYSSGETWETLYYGTYMDTVQDYFETNIGAGANIKNEGEGMFSIVNDSGETLCEVRGAFNYAISKGHERLDIYYSDTDAYTDETSKVAGALAFCSAFAAPYVAGLTGNDISPADVANAIQDKLTAGDYTEFTRGDGGLAAEIKMAGIPMAFFLYNDYNAHLFVGSTPIEQHKLSVGLDPGSPASDNTSGNDNDSESYSGTDAETFAALVVRYFKNDLENNVRTEVSADGEKIYFYDAAVTNSEDYFMWVSLDRANDISDGIQVTFDNDLAGSYIEQGDVNTVLIMMTPCAAAYLSLTEGKNVTLDELAEQIGNAEKLSDTIASSYFKYGSSYVSTSVTKMPRLGWIVSVACDKND